MFVLSVDPVRFMSGGRCSTLLRVTIKSIVVVLFGVLQLGVWMVADGGVVLLRLHRMKFTASGSGDYGKNP
jgi:hypothetical protein